jgi:uncharacterized sulfatase
MGLAVVVVSVVTIPLSPSAQSRQPAVTEERRPNILFIMSDDLGNELGTLGHPMVRTPNIDRLAQQGTRFDRAYDQYPLCNPSRASLLTGLRPDTIRIYDLATHFRENVRDVVTLPQFFRNQGYRTARVGKIYHYDVPREIGTSGLDDAPSWETVINPKGIDAEKPETITVQAGRQDFRIDEGPDEQQTDGMIATEAIKLLERHRDEPFFLAVGFFRPHFPYIAPRKYFEMYPLDQVPTPGDPTSDIADVPAPAVSFTRPLNWNMTDEQMRNAIRGYYAGISFMDAQLGRVLDALDRLKLRDNTIVVFTSDHGYNLGQKGQWMKQSLYEHVARSPLVIAAPGKARGQWTHRVVEYLDIYPTLVDLAGFDVPASLPGRSMKALLADPRAPWTDVAYSQVMRGFAPFMKRSRDGSTPPAAGVPSGAGGAVGLAAPQPGPAFMGYSVRTARWRYTEWEDGKQGVELYDHWNDPGEVLNLAADAKYASVLAQLKPLLDRLPNRYRGERQ